MPSQIQTRHRCALKGSPARKLLRSERPRVYGNRTHVRIVRELRDPVKSQTRMSVLSGSSRPNSARTARGWRTTRDRYASLLYQEGDGPRSAIG